MITALVIAFPQSRILVLGKVEHLKRVHGAVHDLVPEEFLKTKQLALVHGGSPFVLDSDDDEFPRLIFCTPTAAADLDSEKCEIVVLLDAYEALHQVKQRPLIQTDARFRLFGLLSSERKPTPYETARLLTTFGFQQLDLRENGLVRREGHYVMIHQGCKAPDGTEVGQPGIGSLRKPKTVDPLKAYIHNHARNDTIARLARQLKSGQPLNSNRFREIQSWLAGREQQPCSVTILVDRLDHAVQLHKKLPNWPIIAKESNLWRISGSTCRMINPTLSQWVPCQIVVSDAIDNVSGYHADVLIWAAGGQHVNLPEPWLYGSVHPGRPFLVVDFQDDFSPATRRSSRQRAEGLQNDDVFPIGKPAFGGRIQLFEQMLGGSR
jgi:hypothetical protein